MGLNPEGQSAQTEPEDSQMPQEPTPKADRNSSCPDGNIPIETGIHPDDRGTVQTGPPPTPE